MPLDRKLWMEKFTNDETSIALASLLIVLEGVAVATSAPDEYVQPLAQWLRHYGVPEGSDSAPSITSVDIKTTLDFALPFNKWFMAILSNPKNNKEGVQQLAQLTLAVALLREKARRRLDVDTANLDTTWGLVYEAIISAQGTQLQILVSRSAHGFLAVSLCSLLKDDRIEELWRLHIWLPDGQRGKWQEICLHAHQPFGQSWTLLGRGTNCNFKVDNPGDPSLTTHAVYECSYTAEDGNQTGSGYLRMNSTIRNTRRLVRATLSSEEPHSRDMSYDIPAGAFHRLIVSGSRMHATFFVFDAHRGFVDKATVLGPKDGSEWTQPRDVDGITPQTLAQLVDATRSWEQAQGASPEGHDESTTVMGYYRFFRGLELLHAGRQENAFQYLNPHRGCTPAQAFAREPSQQHRKYIEKLIEVGAGLDLVDESGYTALDYAVQNGDTETEALIRGRPSIARR